MEENNYVIDFKDYGLSVKDPASVGRETLVALGKRIVDVFRTYGFCYLKNHGVDETKLQKYRRVSRNLFALPTELKEKYLFSPDFKFGWLGIEGEHLNKDRPEELKQTFNYTPESVYESWPPVDEFEDMSKDLFQDGADLAYRFCDVLSLGLELPMDFMRNAHKCIGKKNNASIIRTLYYPPLAPNLEIKPGQLRLGEHTDYGTVSFVFQDDVGGLEVLSRSGEFMPADPIPGTTLVVIAALLQRWTSDDRIATTHRIPIPKEEFRRKALRQSVVWFLQPDDEYVIKCLDGTDKYEPITSYDYEQSRFSGQVLY